MGSPPHTRGIQLGGVHQPKPGGITPAHAGNTCYGIIICAHRRDHPRTRGEYRSRFRSRSRSRGSPPHTRGILKDSPRSYTPMGITPAHAGNTCRRWFLGRTTKDHPRTRGEYILWRRAGPSLSGSPPHTRGILNGTYMKIGKIGITPAHAGNTSDFRSALRTCRDHPRTRGEYSSLYMVTRCKTGSPPHTRGIPVVRQAVNVAHGITPAHAGNTCSRLETLATLGDHPRTRGEYHFAQLCHGLILGSPPHTRGIRVGLCFTGDEVGITPAHAGNTGLR